MAFKRLETDQIEKIVKAEISDAFSFMDSEIVPTMDEAEDYYNGDLPEQQAEGRSKFVVPVTRIIADNRTEQTLRVITAASQAVEFAPTGPEDVANAKALTDRVSQVYERDNNGVLLDYLWLKEANRYGLSVAEIEVRKTTDTTPLQTEANIPTEQLILWEQDEAFTVLDARQDAVTGLWAVTYKRTQTKTEYPINVIPRDQFFFSADSVYDLRSGQITGSVHGVVVEKTVGEAVADGLDREDLLSVAGQDPLNDNDFAAQFSRDNMGDHDDGRTVRLARAYIKLDVDGDGHRETIEAVFAGSKAQGKLLSWREVKRVPLVPMVPGLELDSLVGRSAHTDGKKGQELKTAITRLVLDNFYSTSTPRLVVNPYSVHMDDVVNPSINSPIRAENTSDVHQLNLQFTGQAGFSLLEWSDQEIEQSTGVGKTAMAISADTFQTPTAYQAMVNNSAHNLKAEINAMICLEAKRTLYRLLAEIIADEEITEGEDAVFSVRRDVRVNVGIGSGTRETKIAHLREIIGYQTQAVQALGPSYYGPLFKSLQKLVEAQGFKNSEAFFPTPTPGQLAPPPPQADPELELKRQELELKAMDIQADNSRKDKELELENARKVREIELEYQLKLWELRAGSTLLTDLPPEGM